MEHLLFVGKNKPLQTIAQALAAATAFAPQAVKIVVAGGRYPMLAPLTIAQSNLSICAAVGQAVVFTGSLPLAQPCWQPSAQNPNIFTTTIAKHLAVDGFFFDDTPQILARYPNYQPDALPLGGVVSAAEVNARAARWANPSTGHLRALHEKGWGGNDYIITGRDATAETGLALQWVGDNNRGSGYMPSSVMVEGIAEELDAPGEWFYDAASGVLSFYPPIGFDIADPSHHFEVAVCSELFTICGKDVENPVENIAIEGITLQNTKRSMFSFAKGQGGKAYTPLLRGDWAIVPSGAITVQNAKEVAITNCNFYNIGGNALFFAGYNQGHTVHGNRFCHLGACGIQLVGSPCAVDDPSFWPHAHYPKLQVHATTVKHPAQVGPITEDYPRDITIAENYIYDIGQYEKQSSGINCSVASRINILHNTIHKSARSNININDGSFGGHEIAYNDIFDAQRETTDHGPLNAWGRDRFWSVPRYNAIGEGGEAIRHYTHTDGKTYDTALLDAYQPTRIHHNRFHHAKGAPHSWGIDLDDGSSNYEIYQNLCLGLGIKLREGFARRVWSNIIIDGKLEIHVSYTHARDKICGNLIVNTQPWNFIAVDATRFAAAEYRVRGNWYYALGQHITLPPMLTAASQTACTAETANTTQPLPDATAIYNIDPHFADPATGDYTPTNTAAMQQLGFAPFAMQFGAALAQTAPNGTPPPYPLEAGGSTQGFAYHWQGAQLCDITDAIISATASAGHAGAYVVSAQGKAATLGLRGHDVIKTLNGHAIANAYELVTTLKQCVPQATSAPHGVGITLGIHREGAVQTINLI